MRGTLQHTRQVVNARTYFGYNYIKLPIDMQLQVIVRYKMALAMSDTAGLEPSSLLRRASCRCRSAYNDIVMPRTMACT